MSTNSNEPGRQSNNAETERHETNGQQYDYQQTSDFGQQAPQGNHPVNSGQQPNQGQQATGQQPYASYQQTHQQPPFTPAQQAFAAGQQTYQTQPSPHAAGGAGRASSSRESAMNATPSGKLIALVAIAALACGLIGGLAGGFVVNAAGSDSTQQSTSLPGGQQGNGFGQMPGGSGSDSDSGTSGTGPQMGPGTQSGDGQPGSSGSDDSGDAGSSNSSSSGTSGQSSDTDLVI